MASKLLHSSFEREKTLFGGKQGVCVNKGIREKFNFSFSAVSLSWPCCFPGGFALTEECSSGALRV